MAHAHCVLNKAKNTHPGCVILIAFLRQGNLRERASMLRYTYIACIVTFIIDEVTSVSSHYVSLLCFPLSPAGNFMCKLAVFLSFCLQVLLHREVQAVSTLLCHPQPTLRQRVQGLLSSLIRSYMKPRRKTFSCLTVNIQPGRDYISLMCVF
jgi:hypothetical protein